MHFISAQVRLPAVTTLKESVLSMGGLKPSWAGSALAAHSNKLLQTSDTNEHGNSLYYIAYCED